ncbi:hypothetical protein Tco_0624235 [Tanacetum coccineum]|uniref:Uncharacterized protein n=1 Tax=Tanacetum coccineum TaxID=301880 RepID=A0ABQ4WDF5_9ASTR
MISGFYSLFANTTHNRINVDTPPGYVEPGRKRIGHNLPREQIDLDRNTLYPPCFSIVPGQPPVIDMLSNRRNSKVTRTIQIPTQSIRPRNKVDRFDQVCHLIELMLVYTPSRSSTELTCQIVLP